MPDYRPPRLTVEITDEQANALRLLLPYGLKKQVFGVIIDSLIEAMQNHGVRVLAMVLEKKIDLTMLLGIEKDR